MLKSDVSIPKHVSIILDGNRRFAKRLMKEPWKGHKYGAGKIRELLKYFMNYGITELTLYALSVDNINSRPKNELEMLFKIFRNELRNLNLQELNEEGIRIRFIGNLKLLPEDIMKRCEELEDNTKDNNPLTVNFAIAYGGREEIIEAVKRIINSKVKSKNINEDIINNNLYMPDEPDLIIRTGGERRTSNFLPWQATYSEWIFLDKMWPEFTKDDLKACIEEFSRRKRNYGK
ncbi:di-trans,poly-cis-decaprenylcistransferase [Candidatus Pacearchaeota archaeon]|nr:di-trans,poly-cis-decaprenylcistransferase [Candidatus Pacearchaeota archaeon]